MTARRLAGGRLIVATHNRGKIEEFAALLAPFGIALTAAGDLGLPEPEETGGTFAANAMLKARAAAGATGLPALADDSGIEVDALGGAPGVRTAAWAEGPGGRDFVRAMTRVHDALRAAGAPPPWTARFRAVLALAWADGHVELAEGRIEGRVVWPMRGRAGHGFDPLFQPDGFDRTLAEIDPAEKNRISHRAVALRALALRCFT